MAEIGGTTTQSGIYYQNSIAALYLGRLLDPRPRLANDRVIEVRVEAPEHVDDIVVRHADGSRSFIQAKERLDVSGGAWKKLWLNFEKQTSEALHTGESFSLILVISKYTNDIEQLKELCERAHGKTTTNEWIKGLNKQQLAITHNIIAELSVSTEDAAFKVLRKAEVWFLPLERLEPDHVPQWIPQASTENVALFGILRDMVGGYARIRGVFRSTEILDRLSSVYKTTVANSPHWGCDIYRQTIIASMGTLSVPGTSLSGPIQQIFMWPHLREQSIGCGHRDFEEEDLRWRWDHPSEILDIRNYPKGDCRRAVINAGAGFGKTTLLQALACILSNDPVFVPALISLDELISKKKPVLDYLNDIINCEFDVKIDWEYLCDNGRAVLLFDGLDELNEKSRVSALGAITKFGGRFSEVPFLISVRDSNALNAPLGARMLEIIRLDDGMIERFAEAYKEAGAKIEPKDLLKHARRHPDLGHLIRIPLFLALLLATQKPGDDLPRNRSELLEHYLSLLFSPERYKSFADSLEPIEDLREAAELLAFRGLEHDSIGLREMEAKKILRTGGLSVKASEYVERLIQIGVFRRSATIIHFVYPIVQEYLAACWLVQNAPGEVANRFCKVIHRPWAQTIQFALEMHPEADQIIRIQINKPDDVFHTVLRLIARCVVNGARLTPELRLELGNRLGAAWPSESYSIRSSIGYLLADGFCDPLPEMAIKYISKRWALQSGGAEILVAKADPELTQMVLEDFLGNDLELQYYLHDWQTAVDEIAPKALELYINRVCKPETEEKEIEALMSLIMGLSPQTIPQEHWVNIACDTSMPAHIRIAAHMRCPSYKPTEAWTLIGELIEPHFSGGLNEPLKMHFVLRFFWRLKKADEYFKALVTEPNAPIESVKYLIDSLLQSELSKETKIELLYNILKQKKLHKEINFFLQLMLAVIGCDTDAVKLLESIKGQSVDNLKHWAFHLGYFSEEHALNGLKILDSMTLDSDQLLQMISMLSVGLDYIVEPTVFLCSVLDKPQRHPAAPAFVSWVASRLENLECNPETHLRILESASHIGCRGFTAQIPRLIDEVLVVLQETPPDSEEFDAGYALGSGLRLCERESLLLSEDILLRIIKSPIYNAGRDALNLLLKQCDGRLIPQLIDVYAASQTNHIKENIFTALEKLAARYGKRIIREKGQLKAVEW